VGVGDVLVVDCEDVMFPGDTFTGRECEVDNEGNRSGDCDEVVEDAFGLAGILVFFFFFPPPGMEFGDL
jgi:hypothetical protein